MTNAPLNEGLLARLTAALEPFEREWRDMGCMDHLAAEQLMLDVDCGGEILTVGNWRELMDALDEAKKLSRALVQTGAE